MISCWHAGDRSTDKRLWQQYCSLFYFLKGKRDPCTPSPCKNNGTCIAVTDSDGDADYSCKCQGKFYGQNCTCEYCFLRRVGLILFQGSVACSHNFCYLSKAQLSTIYLLDSWPFLRNVMSLPVNHPIPFIYVLIKELNC